MKQFLLFTSVMLVNNIMCMQNCSTFGPNTSYINRTVFVGGLLVDSAMHPTNVRNNLFLKQIVNQKTSQPKDIKQCLLLFKYEDNSNHGQICKTPINTGKNTTKLPGCEQCQYQRDFNLAHDAQYASYLKSNQEAVRQENQEQRLYQSFLNNTGVPCLPNSTPVSPQSYETSRGLLDVKDLQVSSKKCDQESNVINFQDKQEESQQSHTKQYRPAYETLKTIKKPEAQKQEQSVQVDNTKHLEQQIQRLQECVENLKLKHKKMEDQGYEIRLQNIVNQDNEQKIQRLEERETYYLEIIKKLTGYGMYYQDTIKQLTDTKSELLQRNNELRKESLQYKNAINAYLVEHNKKCDELRLLIQRNDELLTSIDQLKEKNQHTNITLYNTQQDMSEKLGKANKDKEQIQDQLTQTNKQLSEANESIQELRKYNTQKEQELQTLANNNAILNKIIQENDLLKNQLNQTNVELNNQIQQLKSEKDQKDVEIEKMQRNHNTEIEIKNNEMQKLNIQIHELISEKNTQKQQIIQKDAEIKEIQCKYNELINSYEELKNYSNVLQQELNNINNILPSLQSTTQQSTMAASTRMSPVITKQ